MTAVLDRVTDVQKSILDGLESVQGQVVSANERIAKVVTPRVPDFELPFADQLPKPAELVDNYFSFVNKTMKANRKFASKVVDVWTPKAKPAAKKAATKS